MRRQSEKRGALYNSPTYVDFMARVASNVRRLRAERGWTQEEAAHRCQDMQPFVYRGIEAAKANPTAVSLARLAAGFNVDPSELLTPTRRQRGRSRKELPAGIGPTPSNSTASSDAPSRIEQPVHLEPSSAKGTHTPYDDAMTSAIGRALRDSGRDGAGGDSSFAGAMGEMLESAERRPLSDAEVTRLLRAHRDVLAAEVTRLDSMLRDLAGAPLVGVGEEAPPSPRIRTVAVVLPRGRFATLRDFIVALLRANDNGLTSREVIRAARDAGRKRLEPDDVHFVLHALHRRGHATREGERGSYVYRLKG